MDSTISAALIASGSTLVTAVAGFLSGAYLTNRTTRSSTENLRLQLAENRADQLRERQHTLYDEIITYSIHRELTRDVTVSTVVLTDDPRAAATKGYEPPVWLPFLGRVELLASPAVSAAFQAAHQANGHVYTLHAELPNHRGVDGITAGREMHEANEAARDAEAALRATLRSEVQQTDVGVEPLREP